MKGIIKTYLPEKKYGFIKGDDGKDYFFHENEFHQKVHVEHLCEEAYVDFNQHASPKGYYAKNCTLVSPVEVLTYVTPDELLTSKYSSIRGWEIIELGNWVIHGTSRDAPDAAKRDIIDKAKRIGANALINLEYYKTTGSEPGTGYGTYHYTIHNFRGRTVFLAKKNSKGCFNKDDLLGLNKKAEILKKKLIKENITRTRSHERKWVLYGLAALSSDFFLPNEATFWIFIATVIIYNFIEKPSPLDGWLEKRSCK